MTRNVGKWDKAVRIGIGATLIVIAFLSSGALGELMRSNAIAKWAAVLIGAYLAITGAIGVCPIYSVCKISTHKVEMDMQGL